MKEIIGGRYEFDRATDIIGRGGMGMVYRGKDTQTGNVVAIKQLKPDLLDDSFTSRFLREAEVMRRLSHPHILTIYDTISDAQAGYYLVMEYIGGGSLWDELQAYVQLPIPRVLTLSQNLASALMMVHQQGIIHRDIKPANVLIADDASPRLSDFGVIHITGKTTITQTGALVGTIDYLPPEVFNGRPVTHQADIWAFGVMLYEMIAGVRPFTGATVGETIHNIITNFPANLIDLRPDMPKNLILLVDWMLLKDPEDRIADMTIVHQTLSEILSGGKNLTTLFDIKPSLVGKKPLKRVGSLPKLFADEAFHDRDHQQADITNAILGGKSLVGVYGRGGIGKTALTCKVLGDFEKRGVIDGVAYLRADSTPPLDIISLFDTLSEFVPDGHLFHDTKHDAGTSTTDKTRLLLDALSGRRYLVFIDNLETLQDTQNYAISDSKMRQFFETILDKQGSPLTVIITSRYPIPFPNTRKAYETVIRLDEGLPPADAIAFLRGIDNQSVLPSADDQLLVWIDKVGGYPRGLEALVGYLDGGQTRHIDDLLEDNSLFEGEVLSNIVHHIVGELPDTFRKVMAGVALIGQATTRAELDYLLIPYMESASVRVILERLVDSHFLSYNRQTRAYSLHPIDRDYALSGIPQGSPADDETSFTRYRLHGRMAGYYKSRRKPQSEWRSLDDIAPQLSEMEHLYAIGEYDGVGAILVEIDFNYLTKWGYTDLSLLWLTRVEGKISDPAIAMVCIGNLGSVYRYIGDTQTGITYSQRALDMARLHDNQQQEARNLNNLANGYAMMGQLETAIGYYLEGLALARQINVKTSTFSHLFNLAYCYLSLGQAQKSIEYYQQALKISQETQNKPNEGVTLTCLGAIMLQQGRYADALVYLQSALDCLIATKSADQLNYTYSIFAVTYWFMDDLPHALTAIHEAYQYDLIYSQHRTAVLDGCILYSMRRIDEAKIAFTDAIRHADMILAKTRNQYEPLYNRALALTGLWLLMRDATTLQQAMVAYEEAVRVNGNYGILLENRQWLERLLAYGDMDGTALVRLLGGR
jgi:serine/threonine protein kinase/tetratricopeptide (TPR) repeat protein